MPTPPKNEDKNKSGDDSRSDSPNSVLDEKTPIGRLVSLALSIITTVIGAAFVARMTRRRRHQERFVIAILKLREELDRRIGNMDGRFIEWHSESVRVLNGYADAIELNSPAKWAKIKKTWDEYRMKGFSGDGRMLQAGCREKLVQKLNDLEKIVDEA